MIVRFFGGGNVPYGPQQKHPLHRALGLLIEKRQLPKRFGVTQPATNDAIFPHSKVHIKTDPAQRIFGVPWNNFEMPVAARMDHRPWLHFDFPIPNHRGHSEF